MSVCVSHVCQCVNVLKYVLSCSLSSLISNSTFTYVQLYHNSFKYEKREKQTARFASVCRIFTFYEYASGILLKFPCLHFHWICILCVRMYTAAQTRTHTHAHLGSFVRLDCKHRVLTGTGTVQDRREEDRAHSHKQTHTRTHSRTHIPNVLECREGEKEANKHHIIIIMIAFSSFRNTYTYILILLSLSVSVLFGFVGHMLVYVYQ